MVRHIISALMISWLFVAVVVIDNSKAADKPNIILVMSDDQGLGETSYNGLL